jgi:hypothetical protein
VLTIEENYDWFAALRSKVPWNVDLNYVPVDPKTRNVEGVTAVLGRSSVKKYDVIIIDGHLRN